MARLSAAQRLKLPDRSFAYVDSLGARRLPIADAAHVRNALARFDQVEFESDEARDVARIKLLRAAKRFRIVPVGFIDNQLRAERALGAADSVEPAPMPSGFVTLLFTDIERSTALLEHLGDRYEEVLTGVREVQRVATIDGGGCVVEERADEFFGAFESPRAALDMALATQRGLDEHEWPDGVAVRLRIGVHAGYPTVSGENYIGMAVHTAARICAAAHGGQIVISDDTRLALTDAVPTGMRFRKLGSFRLRGIPNAHDLFQVRADGLMTRFPPLRV